MSTVHHHPHRALVRVTEAAVLLDVSEQSIRRMVRDGRLEGVRLGATPRHPLRVDLESLQRIVERGGDV
jgi:excisionase family DNA binding protein